MALCAAVTLLIPETKGRTIDEIERGVLYGEDNSVQTTSAESSPELQGRDQIFAKSAEV
jgi:hypothetical protein